MWLFYVENEQILESLLYPGLISENYQMNRCMKWEKVEIVRVYSLAELTAAYIYCLVKFYVGSFSNGKRVIVRFFDYSFVKT